MPQIYDIGGTFTAAEGKAAIAAIVPPHIYQRLRFQEAMMLQKLQQHLPNWFAHEVNRVRRFAFTSNTDEGFRHEQVA